MGDMTRGALITAAATAATGVGIGVLAQEFGPQEPETPPTSMVISRIDGEIPLAPDDRAWKDAEVVTLPVLAQQAANPTLAEASLKDVQVSGLVNDRELALRIRFRCPGPADLPGLAAFGDAVAMQLPLAGPKTPPITMGAPGQPVHILRWSSIWQRDVDRGRSRVETIFPNTVRDVSPSSILPPETAKLYSSARAVGNPVAQLERKWPVEEAFAEGFGSLTPMPQQKARARGSHHDKHWSVIIAAPIDRGSAGDLITDRPRVPVAFAIWIGEAGNRGSRKHYTEWIECTLA